jgi:uncharacterized membrane protein HdeD (DUF308 family)
MRRAPLKGTCGRTSACEGDRVRDRVGLGPSRHGVPPSGTLSAAYPAERGVAVSVGPVPDIPRVDLGTKQPWWFLLINGVLWLFFAYLLLQWDLTTVWSVAIFASFGFIAGGLSQLMLAFTAPGWRWLYLLGGLACLVAGVIALIWPDTTFLVLARLFGWYLLIRGTLDIVKAFSDKDEYDLWWVSLVMGIVQIVVAVWAVRYPGRSLVLLVLWIGIAALMNGVRDIVLAFRVRSAQKESGFGGGPRPAVA